MFLRAVRLVVKTSRYTRSFVVCDVTAEAAGGNGGRRETVGAESEKMSESESKATFISGRLLQ